MDEAAWKSQIVLCYEREPYVAFEVTSPMLEQAIAVEDPPMTSEGVAHDWLIGCLNFLRENLALVRDHSEEVMFTPAIRNQLALKAILVVQVMLARKQQSLATCGAGMLNLLAGQSTVEPQSPAFQFAALSEPLSVAEIRAMSTAKHLYLQDGDTLEMVESPQQSRIRSKNRSCISIQAYWHNDQPGGLMLEAQPDVENGQTDLDNEMEFLDEVVMRLAETRPSAKDCDAYLRYLAAQQERDKATSFQIMAAIAYAEEAGYLQSDEFNGMLYIYRLDDDQIYIDRKDRR